MALAASMWLLHGETTPWSAPPPPTDRDRATERAATASAPSGPAAATAPPNRELVLATPSAVPTAADGNEARASTLTVRVAQDGAPVVGAMVRLHAMPTGRGDAPDEVELVCSGAAPTSMAVTDAGGLARFELPLPNGAVAWVEHGAIVAWLSTSAKVRDSVVAIELGSTSLRGIVFDAHGVPRRGAILRAEPETELIRPTWRRTPRHLAVTDANGEFVIGGLPQATIAVTCEAGDGMPTEKRRVPTRTSSVPSVQFGVSPDSRWWRGRVTDDDRNPVPGITQLVFTYDPTGELRRLRSAPDGTFAVQLPPGTWHGAVVIGSEGAIPAQPTTLVVGSVDRTEDLVLPGKRVLCRVTAGDSDFDVDQALRSVQLELDGTPLPNRQWLTLDGSQCMQWSGLSPGIYRLRSTKGPRMLAGVPDDGQVVDLRGPAASCTIAVTLVDRR